MAQRHFKKLCIVGLGLVGSSVALAARARGLVDIISGHDISGSVRDRASELGFCDEIHADAEAAARDADLVVIAVPVRATGSAAAAVSPALTPGAVVTDVGSVKTPVAADVAPHIPPGVHFIPGHPIAGTEHSGPDAGFAELFEDRWWILTPDADTCPEALARLTAFWEAVGARLDTMSAAHHDRVLAITSHLPHLIAYNIVGTVADLETATRSEVIKYSASGFRDFTRIAASDPVMWRDVFLSNKDAVLEMLGRFSEDLAVLQRAIRWNDGSALETLFARTREIRRGVIEAGQETEEPDFGRRLAAPKATDGTS